MVLTFVILYLLISVGVGLLAATRVHSAKDFAVAGRSLPVPIVMATVFATWFGAEAVMGISATFAKEGLRGVVADPFGSSLCLVLAGLFFAPRFYRLNLWTVGDYYRLRYDRRVEVLCTLCIVASYLGWVAAQFKVLGLVLNVVTQGAVSQSVGMMIGAVIVLTYTTFGGMFSVAILDFVQLSVIVGGLLYIASVLSDATGGVGAVLSHARDAGRLEFFPSPSLKAWIPFVGAGVTMMLGSIPQQDVFQRITSAKDERTAVRGSLLGAALYFVFCFVPMFIAYSALMIDPVKFGSLLETDAQLVLPTLILEHTPVLAQVMFFGAVLSAVMSCSSATLLAPSVLLSENVIRGMIPHMDEKGLLTTDAGCAGWLCRRRPGDCADLRVQHLPVGGQYLQGDARRGICPAVCRSLLETGHDTGRALCDRRRVGGLAWSRIHEHRADRGAPTTGWPRGGGARHDHRFVPVRAKCHTTVVVPRRDRFLSHAVVC